MWILLNNVPVNIFEISDITIIKEFPKEDKTDFVFFYKVNGERKISKRYLTNEQATIARNSLIETINKIVSELRKLEI